MRQAQTLAAPTAIPSRDRMSQPENVQPYMQNKAELGAEQTRHDVQPASEVYELMERNQRQEMSGEEAQQPLLSLSERHELRGEDHANELDSTQEQQIGHQDPHRYTFDAPVFTPLDESLLLLHEFV